jgi:hypothetical protein
MGFYECRKYKRYYCQSPVMIYSSDEPDNYYYGLSYNYSKGGMYVKTDGELTPEDPYLIRMLNYEEDSEFPENHDEYAACVKWAKSAECFNYANSQYYYGYGFAFLGKSEEKQKI